MATVNDRVSEFLQVDPDNTCFDVILCVLGFSKMVEMGLEDSRQNRTISNEEMGHRILLWKNKTDVSSYRQEMPISR